MPKETNLVEDDNARLDEALAKFSGDFGGSADAMTVAEELRQGAEMVKAHTLEVAASRFFVIYADTITFVSITAFIIALNSSLQPFLHVPI